ncbi:MAG: DEAD/DEAH box helicase [Chitinophagales bacterium]|nr:DEAD/DEAH box helicase [Chitinophagales bacterium]
MDILSDKDFYDSLLEIYKLTNQTKSAYSELRKLLLSLLKQYTNDEALKFPDLYSRLTFVCEKYNFSKSEQFAIQTMRKNAHSVLVNKKNVEKEILESDIYAVGLCIQKLTTSPLPSKIKSFKDTQNSIKEKLENNEIKLALARFYVKEIQASCFMGYIQELSTDIYKVIFDTQSPPFLDSLKFVKSGHILHLINCHIKNKEITPELFILEPDYLLDISSIAECFKGYSTHPFLYYMNQLSLAEATTPILIGNMANYFLDVFVHTPLDKEIVFKDTMKEVFKIFPFEISVNTELDDNEKRLKFFEESQRQFNHIKHTVRSVFKQQNIDKDTAILEPSFICPQIGVQGRLDFLSLTSHKSVVIELKSGKAPFPDSNTSLVADNHKSQLFLYQMVIQLVLGIKFKEITSYLFYSKYQDSNANLRMVQPYMDGMKEILNIRNQIVALERLIVEDESFFRKLINRITPQQLLNKGGQNEKFIESFILPQILRFSQVFTQASLLEQEYFFSFYYFVAKEHFIAKSGLSYYEQSLGQASIWLNEVEEKLESGNILIDLEMIENHSDREIPTVLLKLPEYEDNFLPNFRKGDIVILYERNQAGDNVCNKQITRGSIIDIQRNQILIRLRFSQSNSLFLPLKSKYAIEHDFMDSTFRSMYKGLFCFLQTNQERKDLLLQQRKVKVDDDITLTKNYIRPEIDEIVLNAKRAKDYYLLVGPPGTGKTSIVLKSMVEEFYTDKNNHILLLAYTNRAVDEICESILQIHPAIDFIRIGSEFSSDSKFHPYLLKNIIKNYGKREQVKNVISNGRVFVGTVASISGKWDLFTLKKFQVCIIDEASQILEPQLIGLLSLKHNSNHNAIEKFIMIGDYKQLPAIVLQSPESTQVKTSSLINIGIQDRRTSLFERLYRAHLNEADSPTLGMLKKQGRMHADIASFSNQEFYEGKLELVPTPHQIIPLEWKKYNTNQAVQKLIAKNRTAFIPSQKVETDTSFKMNTYEAGIVIALLKEIYQLYIINKIKFDSQKSLGIITPYRNQIALIRKRIQELNIPELEDITIDTVERYQGSQRDIIIFSFCVNHKSQLKLLSNTFNENGRAIDRKLNVALTRAKKQMFIVGNPYFLSMNPIFNKMLKHYPQAKDILFNE